MPRLRAAEGGNSASDTEIGSDDSDGEGGTVPAHLQLSDPRGLAPSALAELVPGWMMVTKSSMAWSGQMAGFKQNPVFSC